MENLGDSTMIDIPEKLQGRQSIDTAIEVLSSLGISGLDRIENLALDRTASIEKRVHAITLLVAQRKVRLPALRDLLSSDSEMVFIETVKVLREMGTEWAASELIARMRGGGDPLRRSLFAWALGGYPNSNEVRDALLDTIAKDPSVHVREHAIESIGSFTGTDVIDALISVLAQGSPAERFWSLYSLGTIGEPRTVEEIRRHIDDAAMIPGFGTIGDEARWALMEISKRHTNR